MEYKPQEEPICYKCKKSDNQLLHCPMCNLDAHLSCFLLDVPRTNKTVTRNWICTFCKVMDSDLILENNLDKSSWVCQVIHKSASDDFFVYNEIAQIPTKVATEDCKFTYFLSFGGDNYSLAARFDLSTVFPCHDNYVNDKTCVCIVNRKEGVDSDNQTYFSEQMEGFDSPEVEEGPDSDDELEFCEDVEIGDCFYLYGTKIVEYTDFEEDKDEVVEKPMSPDIICENVVEKPPKPVSLMNLAKVIEEYHKQIKAETQAHQNQNESVLRSLLSSGLNGNIQMGETCDTFNNLSLRVLQRSDVIPNGSIETPEDMELDDDLRMTFYEENLNCYLIDQL